MTQATALDGGSLACVAADGGICAVVDLCSGRNVEEMRWNEGTERFQALGVHQDPSRTLISVAEKENMVLLWDTRNKDPCMRLSRARTIKGRALQLMFANGASSLVCHGTSSTLVWDLRTQQVVSPPQLLSTSITHVRIKALLTLNCFQLLSITAYECSRGSFSS